MTKDAFFIITAISLIALTGCNAAVPTATAAPTAVLSTATTSSFSWPNGSGDCVLYTDVQSTVYSRPSDQADVFGQVDAGFETMATARTADGWAGFDPGVAQAANIGIFRQRWIFFDDATFSGDCLSIPEEGWIPDPVACYTMPMEPTQVYSEPDSYAILATLDVQDFAAVLGLTDSGWAQVDLGLGNTGLTGIGWMDQAALNLSGSACSSLPKVSA